MNILRKTKVFITGNPIHIKTNNVEETIELGRVIGSLLGAGDVIALIGQLGAGKTYMVKGVAEGQGVMDRKVVTSPSYVLVKQYMGRLPIYHFDAYRMESPNEMYDIDCIDYFWNDGISIIEWADKVIECLPDEFIKITITIINATSRDIHVSYKGERYKDFLRKLREKVKCLI
ncbi:MAG: tRNA (adenosine(37)-N6)-threonylcarbamoyltransferase complex ATPase subunit type 1 TsaE [Candidatus Scalinduaceae bacterium]